MKKYSVILFLIACMACELAVDVNVPPPNPKLTLNAFFTPDSVWTARVHKSRYILDQNDFQPADDAQVLVYHNGAPIDTLQNMGNGWFRSDSGKPLMNETYEMRATATWSGMVSGTSHAPEPVTINHVEVSVPENPSGDNPKIPIKIRFQDPPQKNYYMVSVQTQRKFVNVITGEVSEGQYNTMVESDDPAIDNESYNSYHYVFFDDALIQGKEAVIPVSISYWATNGVEKVIVNLWTVSEDFYKYEATWLIQQRTSGDPFVQPVNVYNNIENGFGVFAGYGRSTFTHTLGSIHPEAVIKSFTPLSGKPGDAITIFGENFDPTPSNNFVTINGNYARVETSTENELKVIIPMHATSGRIAVRTYKNNIPAVSDDIFEVIN